MAHEIVKHLLEHAETFEDRTEVVRVAMSLGMALYEIEECLDWWDSRKPLSRAANQDCESPIVATDAAAAPPKPLANAPGFKLRRGDPGPIVQRDTTSGPSPSSAG